MTALRYLRMWWLRLHARGWVLEWIGDNAHVMPIADLVCHEPAEGCACGPEAVLHQRDDGDRWVISHHSLDRRETRE